MKTFFAFLTAIVAVLAGICTLNAQQLPPKNDPAANDLKALVQGNNEFALELFGRFRGRTENLFFCPLSISTALAMPYVGAGGDTSSEIAKTLHFKLSQERLPPAVGAFLRTMKAKDNSGTAELYIANRLWGQTGYRFRPDFLRLMANDFESELQVVDFQGNSEGARRAINQWTEEITQKKIVELLAPGDVDEKTRLVLTNAVYFKAGWFAPFAKALTKELPFHVTVQEKVNTPMMYMNLVTGYYEEASVQLLELPYADNRRSFYVVLPRKNDGLAEVENLIDAEWLNKRLGDLKKHGVALTLPKFRLQDQLRLGSHLSYMGMHLAFSPLADFKGISLQDKFILRDIIHKSFIEVDEKGAEAAAATATTAITLISMPPRLPYAVFLADHPFLFFIRDNPTGAILFLGRVSDPRSR